jgi:ribose 5-phosphate isomerase B
MTVSLGSDHAGFRYKQAIKAHLEGLGHVVLDFGTDSDASCDYPDFVRPAALAVQSGEAARGIVLGGSGNGEAMVCNRLNGIRCAVCWNEQTAYLARQHNDANMISLGERMMDEATALRIVAIFLSESFEGGRHVARIQKIDL